MLLGEKLLLVASDQAGDLFVFLDRLSAIDRTIKRHQCKQLRRDKIGRNFHLVFDESQKMLVIVSADKVSNPISSKQYITHLAQLLLHIFKFDDTLHFRAVGSPIPLSQWYPEGTSICHACSVTGTEEILFVDSQAIARIFSLVTLQFRLVYYLLCG